VATRSGGSLTSQSRPEGLVMLFAPGEGQCRRKAAFISNQPTAVCGKGLTSYIYIYRLLPMKIPRISPETLLVLERFIERPTDWRYGYDLSRETRLKSGTLYPILMRLEKCTWLEASWVATEVGVPPRHTYRLTPNGLELARTKLAEARSRSMVQQPAFCGGWE
jgi:PadR family transcriptional regulator PadR